MLFYFVEDEEWHGKRRLFERMKNKIILLEYDANLSINMFFFFFSLITSSTNFCDYLLVKFFFFFFFFQPLLPISAQMIKFALELIQCGFIKQTAREKNNNNNNNNTLSFFFLFFLSLFFSFNHATALSRK